MRTGILALFCGMMVLLADTTYASSFTVWKIGTIPTNGKRYTQWWYTGKTPTIYGTTDPQEELFIEINGYPVTTRAEGNGNWSYKFDTLRSGSHQIRITTDSDSYTFLLTLGTDASAHIASTSAQLPVAGGSPLLFAGLLGLAGTTAGWYFRHRYSAG